MSWDVCLLPQSPCVQLFCLLCWLLITFIILNRMCKGFAWTAKDTDLRPGTHTFVISKVPVLYSRCAIYFVLILLSVTSIEIFIYFCSFKGLQSFSLCCTCTCSSIFSLCWQWLLCVLEQAWRYSFTFRLLERPSRHCWITARTR